MNIIEWFQRVDDRLASNLPSWPVSLIMLIAVLVGLALAMIGQELLKASQ